MACRENVSGLFQIMLLVFFIQLTNFVDGYEEERLAYNKVPSPAINKLREVFRRNKRGLTNQDPSNRATETPPSTTTTTTPPSPPPGYFETTLATKSTDATTNAAATTAAATKNYLKNPSSVIAQIQREMKDFIRRALEQAKKFKHGFLGAKFG